MDSIKERIGDFWEDVIFFYVPFPEAKNAGLAEEDSLLLDEIGLPSWTAPNMHFHAPEALTEHELLMGQDRDDNPIIYDKRNGNIIVRKSGDEDFLMASGLKELWDLLIAYADKVEASIEGHGNRSVVDNQIPDFLIDRFETFVTNKFSTIKTFWALDIRRLRSHLPDVL